MDLLETRRWEDLEDAARLSFKEATSSAFFKGSFGIFHRRVSFPHCRGSALGRCAFVLLVQRHISRSFAFLFPTGLRERATLVLQAAFRARKSTVVAALKR